ncbi:GAF domain-containing protein [Micromonospora sp. M12]
MLDGMARCIENLAPQEMLVSVLLADPDARHLRHGAAPSLPDFYNHAIDGIATGEGVGSCGTAAHRREPVIVTDIATDPFWDDFRAWPTRPAWPPAGPRRSWPATAACWARSRCTTALRASSGHRPRPRPALRRYGGTGHRTPPHRAGETGRRGPRQVGQ